MILAGDIGGTHTRLALFENGEIIGEEKIYASQQYLCLEDILVDFLKMSRVEKACFGVAGPICNKKAKITNLPWVIEECLIEKTVHISAVHLLNDLEANAYGLEVLKPEDLLSLHEGKEQRGNRALIAAGTGLGEAALVWDGKKHKPFACEGGHVSFAPTNDEEIELLIYLRKKFSGHVSYERLVSGPGLCNLYDFIIEAKKERESSDVRKRMEKEDRAKVISECGSQNRDRACRKAVDWFLSIYGAASGNVALQFFCLAGLYIGGGIAPQLIEKFKEGKFYSAYLNKGRFESLLSSIPIRMILNDKAALLGAANYAENYQ